MAHMDMLQGIILSIQLKHLTPVYHQKPKFMPKLQLR